MGDNSQGTVTSRGATVWRGRNERAVLEKYART